MVYVIPTFVLHFIYIDYFWAFLYLYLKVEGHVISSLLKCELKCSQLQV